jgi:hypothetical protein
MPNQGAWRSLFSNQYQFPSLSGAKVEEANFPKIERTYPFLQKPFGVDEFLAVVHHALGRNNPSAIRH